MNTRMNVCFVFTSKPFKPLTKGAAPVIKLLSDPQLGNINNSTLVDLYIITVSDFLYHGVT